MGEGGNKRSGRRTPASNSQVAYGPAYCVCFEHGGPQHPSQSGQPEPHFQGPLGPCLYTTAPPPPQPPETPAPAPSHLSLSLTSTPPALARGGAGLPCWGAPHAAGSPSTYPARLLTGRRSTCFLMMLSPVGDGKDHVTGENTARLGTTGDLRGLGGFGHWVCSTTSGRQDKAQNDPFISCLRVVC